MSIPSVHLSSESRRCTEPYCQPTPSLASEDEVSQTNIWENEHSGGSHEAWGSASARGREPLFKGGRMRTGDPSNFPPFRSPSSSAHHLRPVYGDYYRPLRS